MISLAVCNFKIAHFCRNSKSLQLCCCNLSWRKSYHKELVRQRFCRTFKWTLRCDLPRNPCFIGGECPKCLKDSLVLRSSLPAIGVIWALRAQSPQKVWKSVPRPLGPGGRKCRRSVKKSPKFTIFGLFGLLFDFSFDFFDPRGREPREPIFGLFVQLGPEGAKQTL